MNNMDIFSAITIIPDVLLVDYNTSVIIRGIMIIRGGLLRW